MMMKSEVIQRGSATRSNFVQHLRTKIYVVVGAFNILIFQGENFFEPFGLSRYFFPILFEATEKISALINRVSRLGVRVVF